MLWTILGIFAIIALLEWLTLGFTDKQMEEIKYSFQKEKK